MKLGFKLMFAKTEMSVIYLVSIQFYGQFLSHLHNMKMRFTLL